MAAVLKTKIVIPPKIGYEGGGWKYPVSKKTVQVSPGVHAVVGPGTRRPSALYSIHGTSYPTVQKVAVSTRGGKGGGSANTLGAGAAALGPIQKATLDAINTWQASMLTPDQQRTQSRADIDAQIEKALAGIRASTAADQAEANQQANRAQGFAEAIHSLGPQDAAAIAGLYNDAAMRTKLLGTGLSGSIGAAENAQVDQTQKNVADATGGLGQVGGYDVGGLQNVAQYTGVVRPSTDLAEEAANQGAFASWQNTADARHISNIAQDYLSKAQMDQKDLALQRAALEAQRPGLYTQALQSLQSGGRSDMATLVSALGLMGTQATQSSQITAQDIENYVTKALAPYKIAGAKADVAKTTAEAAAAGAKGTGTVAGGKLASGNYWVGTGKSQIAEKIPPGYRLDPSDPTHHTIMIDPANPPSGHHYDPKTKTFVPNTGSTHTPSITQITSAIAAGSKGMKAALTGAPYVKLDNTPAGRKKTFLTGKPAYIPLIPLAKARTMLLTAYFLPQFRKNPQVIATVNDALTALGFK